MRNYLWLTALLAPLVTLWLHLRKWRGKEDPLRFKERFGHASRARPAGTLLWLHASSVGEAMSVVTFIEKLRARFPQMSILLTTGTVTSARLMAARLPKEVIHQYAPVDTPEATHRFLRHWKPDIALFVESELWPNLVMTAHRFQCYLGLINARMSDRSFRSWQRFPGLIRPMLAAFDCMFAQSDDDAARLRALGAKQAACVGNIKYDAAPLPCNEAVLQQLKTAIGTRPVWLAASTHPGEEAAASRAHALLIRKHPALLTIIVPRHPERGQAIAGEIKKYGRVALRSKQEPITNTTGFYVADTLGELGLFYRLSDIVFMGGSLIPHGGQNPLEPARLSCAILTGPHTQNFSHMYWDMEQVGACLRAGDSAILAGEVDNLLSNPDALDGMQRKVRAWMEGKSGAADRLLAALEPALSL